MDAVVLHRLGRRLVDLSRDVTTGAATSPFTPAEIALLEHALHHPGSSVGELATRTGIAQSHVSTSLARLRDRGLVQTTADPTDGRVTRVQLSQTARRAIRRRAGTPADDAIAAAVGDRATARRVVRLLDELAELLLPDGAG